MHQCDFSIIVCCYNSDLEKLKKTIISIVKQTGVTFEIIIADDGSEKRNIEQIKDWVTQNDFKNIKYSFLSQNVGTVKNIVIATQMATGDYIKTISPGDYLFDEFSLRQYLTYFKQGRFQLLFSKAIYYTPDHRIKPKYNPAATGTKCRIFMKKNLCQFADGFLGATIAFPKRTVTYLEEIVGVVRLVEDYPLAYLMLMNNEKVGFINKNLIWYECSTGVSNIGGGVQIKNDLNNFYNYLNDKYQKQKKITKNTKFLKTLTTTGKIKKLLKCLWLKPSYFFFLIDHLLSKFIRRIFYSIRRVDWAKQDAITSLCNTADGCIMPLIKEKKWK